MLPAYKVTPGMSVLGKKWPLLAFSSALLVIATAAYSAPSPYSRCERYLKKTPTTSATQKATLVTPKSDLTYSGIKGYYIMTRLLAGGKFDDIAAEVEHLSQLGVNTLFISPYSSQTKMEWFGVNNTHGYWPDEQLKFSGVNAKTVSSKLTVDPTIGSTADYQKLKKLLASKKIRLAGDWVLNHFGYQDDFFIGGQKISSFDPKYFKPRNPFPDKVQSENYFRELYGKMENETNPERLLQLQDELASQSLSGLPSPRHEVPIIRDHFVEIGKAKIDNGETILRVDAAKHIKREALYQILNEVNAYAKEKTGEDATYIMEFLYGKANMLDVFAKDMLEHVDNPKRVFFLDIPQASELRRLKDSDYSFQWLMDFVNYRYRDGHKVKNYLPIPEDHDEGVPLLTTAFYSRLIYAMSEFISENPNMLFHGAERSGARYESRQKISSIDPNGDVAAISHKIADAMEPYRTQADVVPVESVRVEKDVIVAKRSLEDREIYMAANKKWLYGESFDVPIKTGQSYKIITSEGDVTITQDHAAGVLHIKLGKDSLNQRQPDGLSFVVFEIK